MVLHSEILSDMAELRTQLRSPGHAHRDLLKLNPVRPIVDLGFDALVVLASVAAVVLIHPWLVPVALVVLGNRQRALGNILHDAGHRNLSRDSRINDAIARLLVAPLMFTSLTIYRATHWQHHLALGSGLHDPDLLDVPSESPRHWSTSYWHQVFNSRAWWGSFAGHLASRDASAPRKLFITAWWIVVLGMLFAAAGEVFTVTFAVLWLLSRATAFHLITTFREMCDHFGLQPGGIFTFTRDMDCHGVWRQLIHPRNNGYHLTHHLLPAVPYYRLPDAHRIFQGTPAYRTKAQVCEGYFAGRTAVTRNWQAESRR